MKRWIAAGQACDKYGLVKEAETYLMTCTCGEVALCHGYEERADFAELHISVYLHEQVDGVPA